MNRLLKQLIELNIHSGIAVVVMLVFLNSCSYLAGDDGIFRDRQSDYLDIVILPPMTVPDSLDTYTLDELYVVPEEFDDDRVVFVEAPEPEPLERGLQEGVILKRFGDRRWIVVNALPNQLWPRVRDFWNSIDIPIDFQAPDKGVMETTWLEADVDQSTKDKFRVSIEPGLHPGSSEIFVLHVNVPRNTPIIGRINWPKISVDLEREEELLNQLSSYLAERNNLYQATSVSLLAGNIVAESKAKLITLDGGEKVLQLRIDFPRAWATIGLALDKASIDIDDRDRDQAFYTVSFAGLDDEKRPGFFRRIFTSENEAESHTFNIKLVELESAVEVTIELVDSDEPQELLSEELMRAIHQNLG